MTPAIFRISIGIRFTWEEIVPATYLKLHDLEIINILILQMGATSYSLSKYLLKVSEIGMQPSTREIRSLPS